MRLPLPNDFFAPVRLSESEVHDLKAVEAQLLSAYVASYEAHVNDSNWKLVGQRTGFQILRQRQKKIRVVADESELPALRLVGSVDGTLEEVLYGSTWKSGRERAARAYLTGDGVLDGAILCSIETPSSVDPYRSLSVKWALRRGSHGGLVVKHRDFCYLAATGIVHSPLSGVKLGYRLRHSITFPSCPPFQNHSVVRGQIFFCSLFRQQRNGTVGVFHEGKYDVGGGNGTIGLSVPTSMAEKSLVETLSSLADIRACALVKKLTRVVEYMEGERGTASLSTYSVQESLDGERRCGMCLRCLGDVLKRRCAACRHWTCTECSERQSIISVKRREEKHGSVVTRCFCKACVAKVLSDDVTKYSLCNADDKEYEIPCRRWGHDDISDGEDNKHHAPHRQFSVEHFSNYSSHSDEFIYLRERQILSSGLNSINLGSFSSNLRNSTKQFSNNSDENNTVSTSPVECRRRRSASSIPALAYASDTLYQRQPRRRLSLNAPDIMLRSDVGQRNWESSTSALSLQSPQRI
ncbi:putative START-like domain superfamily protein [Plasmopara halstedii]